MSGFILSQHLNKGNLMQYLCACLLRERKPDATAVVPTWYNRVQINRNTAFRDS